MRLRLAPEPCTQGAEAPRTNDDGLSFIVQMASHRVTYTAMPQTPLREVIKHFSRNFDCGPGASWRFIMDGEALPMVGSGPSLRRLADCEIEDGDVLDAEANEVEDNKAEDEIRMGMGMKRRTTWRMR